MDVQSQGFSQRSDLNPDIESTSQEWSYEATVKEIESTIAQIESGDLDLADLFNRFEVAVTRLRQCETFLVERQRQMDILIETLSDEPEF